MPFNEVICGDSLQLLPQLDISRDYCDRIRNDVRG